MAGSGDDGTANDRLPTNSRLSSARTPHGWDRCLYGSCFERRHNTRRQLLANDHTHSHLGRLCINASSACAIRRYAVSVLISIQQLMRCYCRFLRRISSSLTCSKLPAVVIAKQGDTKKPYTYFPNEEISKMII